MSLGGNLGICIVANLTIKWGFSTLPLLTLGQIILIWGGGGGCGPMHCVLFSSLCGHCSLDASISPPASCFPVVTKNIFRLCQMSPRGLPWGKKPCCRGFSGTHAQVWDSFCSRLWYLPRLLDPLLRSLTSCYPFVRRGLIHSSIP